MVNKDFFLALEDLEREKGISKEVFIETLEQALVSAYKKDNGDAAEIRVELNSEKGTIRVFATKYVVDEVLNPDSEITVEEAQEIKKNAKVGDSLVAEIVPKNFGRIAAQTAKQVIIHRLNTIEKENISQEFSEKEGKLLVCQIRRKEGDTIYVDLGKARMEGVLLKQDQLRGDNYTVGAYLKVYVKKVKVTTQDPQILVSRTSPGLVRCLFENEVPEIRDEIIEIMAVAREAGHRSKIAIFSNNDQIDAVGACVGQRGVRVMAVVNELGGEKIDIIPYSEDPLEFIARSLSPAEVKYVDGDEAEKIAKVAVDDDKLSLAIGREGQNARLAAKLTGWKIDVKPISQLWPKEEDGDVDSLEEIDQLSEMEDLTDIEDIDGLNETDGLSEIDEQTEVDGDDSITDAKEAQETAEVDSVEESAEETEAAETEELQSAEETSNATDEEEESSVEESSVEEKTPQE